MRRLVLLGGGHAHVKVLADLAERPLAGWDVHLVTPCRRQICANNALRRADGTGLQFDRLSIDTGPVPDLRITLAGSDALPLKGAPAAMRRRAAALLARRGIAWRGGRRASRIEGGQLHFEAHEALDFDASLVVTGAAAPDWPKRSGLATDERGFIRVRPTLQSVSHPHIFAAGDAAAYHDARPKSGVYAVRAGPILAENLRASCEGRSLRDWAPQSRALYLISTGDRHARQG